MNVVVIVDGGGRFVVGGCGGGFAAGAAVPSKNDNKPDFAFEIRYMLLFGLFAMHINAPAASTDVDQDDDN